MSKLAYCTGLLGVGSLSLTNTAGTTFQFTQLLYLVPLIAIAYDLQILAEDFRAKRAGIFLSSTASSEEQKYEKFVRLRPNILAPVAHTSSTFVLIVGATFILWRSGTSRLFFYSWLIAISFIEAGLLIYTSRMRNLLSMAEIEPASNEKDLTLSTMSMQTPSEKLLNKRVEESSLTSSGTLKNLLNNVSFIASVAQLFLLVLTVIYSNDQYDLWDIGIAVFVISMWINHRGIFLIDKTSALLAQIGVSISAMIIIMFVIVYIAPFYLISLGLILQQLISSPYRELALSGVEIAVALIVYVVLFQIPRVVGYLGQRLKKRRR